MLLFTSIVFNWPLNVVSHCVEGTEAMSIFVIVLPSAYKLTMGKNILVNALIEIHRIYRLSQEKGGLRSCGAQCIHLICQSLS